MMSDGEKMVWAAVFAYGANIPMLDRAQSAAHAVKCLREMAHVPDVSDSGAMLREMVRGPMFAPGDILPPH